MPTWEVSSIRFGDTPVGTSGFTLELLEAHMWTHIPSGAQPLVGLPTAPPQATPRPRTQKAVSFAGGVVSQEAVDALVPARAGFTEHGPLVEQHTLNDAYFFKFASKQTCPFCKDRPHLKQGYRLNVHYEPGSAFGSVFIAPWSTNCNPEGGNRCRMDRTPLLLAHLTKSQAPGLVAPPTGPEEVEPPKEGPQPSAELEAKLRTILRLAGDEPLGFRIQGGVWTIHLAEPSPFREMLSTGNYGPAVLHVFVEGGQARVVCAGFLLASFHSSYVPVHLWSRRLSGVPFLHWTCFEPTLRRALGDGVTLCELEWNEREDTFPPGTSLAFRAKLPGSRAVACAVVHGALHIRRLLSRYPDGEEDVLLSVEDYTPTSLAPKVAAFGAVYGEQLRRLGDTSHDDGRITLEALGLHTVWPWTCCDAIVTGEPAGHPLSRAPEEESSEKMRARLHKALEERRTQAEAEDDEQRRLDAASDALLAAVKPARDAWTASKRRRH